MMLAQPHADAHPTGQFDWQPQPQAEVFITSLSSEFLRRLPPAAELSERMARQSGTRFGDWIDAIFIPDTPEHRQQLSAAGYQPVRTQPALFAQSKGMFPRIGLHGRDVIVVHLKVTSVADFAAVWTIPQPIQGQEWLYRRVLAWSNDRAELIAGERWGWTRFELPQDDPDASIAAGRWLEQFCSRRREFDDDALGMVQTADLLDRCQLPVDQKCALFFQAERDYWERRNRAARVQKARQDSLGLGWGNHDHHTYRSSREHFDSLVKLWEKLGLVCRERFYAGRQAGWGAQVMEQPNTGIITFNDVDLTPDELMGDFSHDGLSPSEKLGTVGLWCALHGEAVLQAGMHHLEAQFDFDSLRDQLAAADVKMMKPFTSFSYLRQAFTEGERWPVPEGRISRALQKGFITAEQAEAFRTSGAIGSHLENLERNEGFKGFNQSGVSEIIAATDPRKQLATT
jgi:hypothetical protein